MREPTKTNPLMIEAVPGSQHYCFHEEDWGIVKTKLDNLDTKIEDVKKVKNSGSSLSKAILVVVLSILAATVTLFGINRNSITALADKNTRQDVELVQHEGQNDLQFYQLNAKIDALLVSQGINPANLEIHIRKVPLK